MGGGAKQTKHTKPQNQQPTGGGGGGGGWGGAGGADELFLFFRCKGWGFRVAAHGRDGCGRGGGRGGRGTSEGWGCVWGV